MIYEGGKYNLSFSVKEHDNNSVCVCLSVCKDSKETGKR